MSHTTAYIDGDVLKYRSAFAGELAQWGCIEPDGECYVATDSRQRAQELIDNSDYLKDCIPKRTAEALPFSLCIKYFNADLAQIMKNTGAREYIMFLTHEDDYLNPRYQVAVTHPYKGNRKDGHTPIHKEAMYHHMIKAGAEVVTGMEADDAMGFSTYNDPDGICVTIDKDLLMIPGKHYNISTSAITDVTDPGHLEIIQHSYGKKLVGYGFKWFCAQMLMGDPVDNIKGIKGIGDVKAFKIMNETKTILEMWRLVRNHYQIAGESIVRADENAFLLWIQRNEGETFREWMEKQVG